jgi:NitT/TauT family transport system ATP-binding protein
LDEPFSALDDLTREKLQDELLELHAASGTAYVLVTHNMEEAVLLAQRIFVFSAHGSILKEIRTSETPQGEKIARGSTAIMSLRQEIRDLWQSAQGGE